MIVMVADEIDIDLLPHLKKNDWGFHIHIEAWIVFAGM